MCNNIALIIFLFFIRILFIIIIPVILLFYKKITRQLEKNLCILELIFIIIFTLLLLIKSPCIINSGIKGFINSFNNNKYTDEEVYLNNDSSIVEEIVTNKIYKTNNNRNVYYFNNSELPLSNKKYYCDDKEIFMKNYGNGITAVSMLLSSALDENIDPIKVYNYAVENDLFECENGVDTYELLNSIAVEYNLHVVEINEFNLLNYINTGGIVLGKVEFNPYVDNFACENSNIIIYNVNNENNYKILNPNDRDYDYICPDNSPGYGSVIKANTNNMSWTSSNLTIIHNAYYALERN